MENPTFQTCRTSETSRMEFRRNDRHLNAKATHSTMYSTMAKLRVCGKKSLNLTHSALEEKKTYTAKLTKSRPMFFKTSLFFVSYLFFIVAIEGYFFY